MNCPRCQAAIEPGALLLPPFGQSVRSLASDWKVWAVALGLNVFAGIVSGALHLGSGVGAASGGAVGIFLILRMRTLRRCPHCGAVTTFAGTPTPP